MTRQNSLVEFNTFIKGLVTEASPINFPENASTVDENFVLKRDGSRARRLGLDYEVGFGSTNTTGNVNSDGYLDSAVFHWMDVGGDTSLEFIVVHTAGKLAFYDVIDGSLSTNLHTAHGFTIFPGYTGAVGISSVGGQLLVATGGPEILVFTYDSVLDSISNEKIRLRIRDTVGIDAFDHNDASVDLRDPDNVALRPAFPLTGGPPSSKEHTYNLRNQGWAIRSLVGASGTMTEDPLQAFRIAVIRDSAGASVPSDAMPSNADILGNFYAPIAAAADETNRFDAVASAQEESLFSEAPRGHFIIDLLDRGLSREAAASRVFSNGAFFINPGTLVTDVTEGGATILESYAGRAFYAGFGNDVVDGDTHSFKLGSYVAFSQLVESARDIGLCYQEADPTSSEDSDLVATDGGLLRIDGAERIIGMNTILNKLVVYAENGVWTIEGGDSGFSANDFKVTQLTTAGCVSVGSIVRAEGSAMYWSHNGIYLLNSNQFGDFQATNLSKDTLHSKYLEIPPLNKKHSKGVYDRFNRTVRWLHYAGVSLSSTVDELIFDLDLGAFYTNILSRTDSDLVQPLNYVPPVVVDDTVIGVRYSVLTEDTPDFRTTFGELRDEGFLDWGSIDQPARLVTGPISGGDFQRTKQIPYLTTHFNRTEDGFTDLGGGEIVLSKPSSCLIRAMWDWTDSDATGGFGTQFESYRFKRHAIPAGAGPFDFGFTTVNTKNKIRGKGRVVSFEFTTSPGKDCQINGWSLILGTNGNI